LLNLIPTPLRRLLQMLGIDRAVGYSLLTQGWNLIAQPITLFLTVTFLDQTEQGYFYTFGSIVGLQMFFELGLGTVTLQASSHEAAHLHWLPDGTLGGDAAAKSRLGSLLSLSACWYGIVAAVLFAILLPAGWAFFAAHDDAGIGWRLPWTWTVLVTTAGLLTTPPYMLIAGCGRVADMVRATAVQKVATNCIQWLALAGGAALLSWPAAQTVGFAVLAGWIFWQSWPAFRDLLRQSADGPRVNWWREVWPFQWRVAVSAPFVYLTSYIFPVVLFARDPELGPVEAGKMGISLAVMNVLISATTAWIGVRMPMFGHLIARREWATLDRVFRRVFVQSTLLAVAGAASGYAILVVLQRYGYRLGTRMLPPWPLALLLANAVVAHMVQALASYLRAHKRDPFYGLFITFGLAMAAAVFTVGRLYGPVGMAGSLLILNTTICLAGGAVLFGRCRRAWHAEPADVAEPVAV
jgi:hypothetical protein